MTAAAPAFCDRCGRPDAGSGHEACAAARGLEPPRFCDRCGRRMKVQVTPLTWTAACSEHGSTSGAGR